MLSFSFIGVSLSTPEFNVYQSKNKQNYPKYSFSFYVMPVRIIFMLMFKAGLISDSIKRSSSFTKYQSFPIIRKSAIWKQCY